MLNATVVVPFAPVGRLAEYGVAGILILVIVLVMGYLLKHVLDQAKDERNTAKADREKFISTIEKVTKRLEELGTAMVSLKDEVERLSEGRK
jgi:Tfp pilus assembly protein PilO